MAGYVFVLTKGIANNEIPKCWHSCHEITYTFSKVNIYIYIIVHVYLPNKKDTNSLEFTTTLLNKETDNFTCLAKCKPFSIYK